MLWASSTVMPGSTLMCMSTHHVGAAAACAEMVERFHAGGGGDCFRDTAQFVLGKRNLEEFVQCRDGHLYRYRNYENGDYDLGGGVAYSAGFAEKHGAGHTCQCGYRREGVAAVVPGVGDHHLRIDPSADAARVPVQPFFHYYRGDAYYQGPYAGTRYLLSAGEVDDFPNTVPENPESHRKSTSESRIVASVSYLP